MLLVEHHGKKLLAAHGIPVPAGMLIRQAQQVRRWRKPFPIALKVQIAAGGRGKAGGVMRADNVEQAHTAAQSLFSAKFEGEEPSALLLEPWLAHERELYLSITIDGSSGGYVVLYSPAGGVEVERQQPLSYPIGVTRNFRAHELRRLISSIEPDDALCARVVALARQLLFVIAATDATTIEINPTAVLADGKLVALDAKIVRDDAAAFRHADIADQIERARKKEPRAVAQALAGNLMMVWLDGNVGLISGGAGMTMAAMDLIVNAGERPACFLDCSSNPTPAGYRLAFRLLDAEPRVKAILVSIFGGGTHIDRVARVICGILSARRSQKPVVLRLNGTGREKADEILLEAGLHNHATLESAVDDAVAKVRTP